MFLRSTVQLHGIDIPISLLERTGSGPEDLFLAAEEHARRFREILAVEGHHRVLDLGCGVGRDAILLLSLLDSGGAYDGVDLDRRSIAWCRRKISRKNSRFRFHHADFRNIQYNPKGKVDPATYQFPVADGSVDRAFAHSLFTHLLPDVTTRYLAETRRVLAPGGIAMYTFFTADREGIEASRRSPVPAFRIAEPYSEGCFVTDPAIPEASVAYSESYLLSLVRASGLELDRPILPGSWVPGRSAPAMQAQDILVLRRPWPR